MKEVNIFNQFAPKPKKKSNAGNIAVVYTRVSHSSQEDNTSLGLQLRNCEAFAERKNLTIKAYFGGKSESAKTDDRKEFTRMLKYIKQSGRISTIIVNTYDRFSRTGISGAKIAEDLLENFNIQTLAASQELDPTTSEGAFLQQMHFLLGHMENVNRRRRTISGMRELAEAGYTVCGNPPKGYTNLKKGRAVDQKIVINEDGKLLKKAFHWKAHKKMSNTEIVAKLKKLGLSLDVRRLSEIFKNPYYCGIIVTRHAPGKAFEAKHEGLVSREMFLKINGIVDQQRANHPSTHKKNTAFLPLKRFVICDECDTPMTGFQVKAKGLWYYKCRTKGCKHTCNASKLHDQFAELLTLFKIEDQDEEIIRTALELFFEATYEEEIKNAALNRKAVNELQAQIETLQERFALGKIDDAMYEKFSKKYHAQLAEISMNNEITPFDSSNREKTIDKIIKICSKPLHLWGSEDLDRKMLFQKIIFPDGLRLSKQNLKVQTNILESFYAPIAAVTKVLDKIKSGQPLSKEQLSACVTSEGFKPSTSTAVMWCTIQLCYEANTFFTQSILSLLVFYSPDSYRDERGGIPLSRKQQLLTVKVRAKLERNQKIRKRI